MTTSKRNWFNTLNEALESEGLLDTWNIFDNIAYGQAFRYVVQDGTKYGKQVVIFRETDGRYERPITYKL
tara:strand:+ start:5484 stop:5693 length:210 start_codon:yes stop_codon:yes gene_type:complete